MISDISAQLYAQAPTETLYHYTTFSGFQGIIERQAIWASDIRYMNDSAELRHAVDLFNELITHRIASGHDRPALLSRFLDWMTRRITNGHMLFAASFRTHGNLLSQWRGYSRPGKGVSVGFPPDHLLRCAARQQFQVCKCVYDSHTQQYLINQVLDAIEQFDDTGTPDQIFREVESDLLRIAAVLKHPSFQEEQEWRVVSPVVTDFLDSPVRFREGTSMLVPYLEFGLTDLPDHLPLAHVYLGPTSSVELSMNSMQMYLKSQGMLPVQGVEYCRIPYRQK